MSFQIPLSYSFPQIPSCKKQMKMIPVKENRREVGAQSACSYLLGTTLRTSQPKLEP
jgi:hypothetical protein